MRKYLTLICLLVSASAFAGSEHRLPPSLLRDIEQVARCNRCDAAIDRMSLNFARFVGQQCGDNDNCALKYEAALKKALNKADAASRAVKPASSFEPINVPPKRSFIAWLKDKFSR